MTGKAKAVSDDYKSALVDLTFNSKPMINLLTMLAEENKDYAQNIVSVICDRIKQVSLVTDDGSLFNFIYWLIIFVQQELEIFCFQVYMIGIKMLFYVGEISNCKLSKFGIILNRFIRDFTT